MKKSTITLGVLAAAIAVGYPTYNYLFSAQSVQVDSAAQTSKFSRYAAPERFISAPQLKQMMESSDDVIVIGALNPLKPDQPIAGSFSMWRKDYSAAAGTYEFGGMRNSIAEMEEILRNYGASKDSTIVLYAANSHHDASRLHWQIRSLGHADVRYLDGGLNAWIGAGYSTGDANPSVSKTDYTAPAPNESKALATLDMVLEAQGSDEWVIIDTRGTDEFDGSATKKGAAGPGAIPGSVHISWTKALNGDTTLKSAEELTAIYGDLIKGKKVIAYCQSGVRSAHTTMVLREALGADAYNYDGSWIEYSYMHYTKQLPEVKVINGKS